MHKVLIVDDEENIRYILSELLAKKGFATLAAPDGASAIELFRAERPHAVLLDHHMRGLDGSATFEALRSIDPAIPVIFLTAHADVHVAVEAMKTGAYDFIIKPPDMDALSAVIRKAVERLELEREVTRLKSAVGASVEGTLGRSEAIRGIIPQLVKVAASDFSIVIQGETGTGKSLVAELVHSMSARASGPFVRVDIGTIPDTLIESELFGSEKGAYTGSDRARSGYFEEASGGTLFMDELENTSAAVQARLLSAVETRKINRVGSSRTIPVDVRIIAASNRDLGELVGEKRLRGDLYFRLNEYALTLPPLRERAEDISFLAGRFLSEACEELKKPCIAISGAAMEALRGHQWTGNVRELKNTMRRGALMATGRELLPGHLGILAGSGFAERPAQVLPLKEIARAAAMEAEKVAIRQALALSSGNKSRTASILKVDYKTLLTKIRSLGLG